MAINIKNLTVQKNVKKNSYFKALGKRFSTLIA